jgi:hypothetical protein
MVQNGLITMPELIRLIWATNGAEILNIAERAEVNAEKRRNQELQNQQQLMQQQAAQQKELQQLQQAFEMEKMNAKAYTDTILAEINASRFARQHDINQNQINDNLERDKVKIQFDAIQKEKDRALELEKHKDDVRLREKEIKLKSIKKT